LTGKHLTDELVKLTALRELFDQQLVCCFQIANLPLEPVLLDMRDDLFDDFDARLRLRRLLLGFELLDVRPLYPWWQLPELGLLFIGPTLRFQESVVPRPLRCSSVIPGFVRALLASRLVSRSLGCVSLVLRQRLDELTLAATL
jgi:hypothetical protein